MVSRPGEAWEQHCYCLNSTNIAPSYRSTASSGGCGMLVPPHSPSFAGQRDCLHAKRNSRTNDF
eukprot:379895-Hanusia_phi.AAC.1